MRFGLLRLHYFLLYAIVGAYLPYMPLYLSELGFADWQIGWVLGVYGLTVMVMPGVMAHVADRHVSNRVLIGAGYGATFLALIALGWVRSFGGMLACSVGFSMCYTPLFALMDGLAFGSIDEVEQSGGKPPAYSSLRIFGSIGFIVPSVGLFAWMRMTDIGSAAAVHTAAGCALGAALLSGLLPRTQRPQTGPSAGGLPSAQAWAAIWRRPVGHLVGPLFVMFVVMSLFYAFYSVYLEQLHIAREWVGLIVNLGVVAEIVMILMSKPILRLLGIRGVMLLGAGAVCLRMVLLASVPTGAVAILTQLLHAPIMVSMYLIPPMYLNLKAGAGNRNSMQGVYGIMCYGGARLCGSVLGGYVAAFGMRWTFAAGALLGGVALGWLMAAFRDEAACETITQRRRMPLATPSAEA
ncbi:MAG: MFS transporter [Planctomycetes bacterium]|nr:MFS transporter [Planctomycetota bacterium]